MTAVRLRVCFADMTQLKVCNTCTLQENVMYTLPIPTIHMKLATATTTVSVPLPLWTRMIFQYTVFTHMQFATLLFSLLAPRITLSINVVTLDMTLRILIPPVSLFSNLDHYIHLEFMFSMTFAVTFTATSMFAILSQLRQDTAALTMDTTCYWT